MDLLSSKFEKKWSMVFLFMYFLIMVPFPWYFNESYSPGWWGVPSYIFGWLIHAVVVLVLIGIFASRALKRPEYNNLPNDIENDQEKAL